ncbi:MAG: FHA domain-containing protein [Lachnospiraceae bacterium]|nr:FHA domain-containing protein [Lachnospiraceae bacterium]MBD5504481.1 FHA domain-containing protein [Lachnospiraceae bacterium]
MWHRKKTDKAKETVWQEECGLLQEPEVSSNEIDTTLILPKEEREGTLHIWKGEPKKYMLHLTDVKNPGRTYKAPVEGAVTIGRKAAEADIVIDYEQSVSARHCRISERDGKFYVEDLNSSNGTLVNGIPLTEEMELYSESTLALGRLELKVQIR